MHLWTLLYSSPLYENNLKTYLKVFFQEILPYFLNASEHNEVTPASQEEGRKS